MGFLGGFEFGIIPLAAQGLSYLAGTPIGQQAINTYNQYAAQHVQSLVEHGQGHLITEGAKLLQEKIDNDSAKRIERDSYVNNDLEFGPNTYSCFNEILSEVIIQVAIEEIHQAITPSLE